MFDDDLLKLINQCHLKYVKKRHRRFLVLSKGFLPYICYYKTLTKFLGMTLALLLRRGLYRVVFSYIILFYR